jgi:hypothetical protein
LGSAPAARSRDLTTPALHRPGERAGDAVIARCIRGIQWRHRHLALVTADHRRDTAVGGVQHARGPDWTAPLSGNRGSGGAGLAAG